MPKEKNLAAIEKEYNKLLSAFNKFKGSFDTDMRNVLQDDANKIEKSLNKFDDLLKEFRKGNQDLTSIQRNFISYMNNSLEEITTSHQDLITRANNIKSPSCTQKIKNYLAIAVECITKLYTAVAKLAGVLSEKISSSMTTVFKHFQKSANAFTAPTAPSGDTQRPTNK